jgi:hypothetical protein
MSNIDDDDRNDTVPAPAEPTARRDLAVLALHAARARVDELTADFARHAGIDTSARRLVQVLGCFAPLLRAVEALVPDAP